MANGNGETLVTRWPGPERPTQRTLELTLREEGLSPGWWSNGPGDRYAEHSHPYHKVLFCTEGSIRFVCNREAIDLNPGDRLDIPPGVVHSAIVGPAGARCVEAARA